VNLSVRPLIPFRVKARNTDGIETGWVDLGSQSTLICPDITPPYPQNYDLVTEPYVDSSTSISMVATTAIDIASPPVSYYFDFLGSPPGEPAEQIRSGKAPPLMIIRGCSRIINTAIESMPRIRLLRRMRPLTLRRSINTLSPTHPGRLLLPS